MCHLQGCPKEQFCIIFICRVWICWKCLKVVDNRMRSKTGRLKWHYWYICLCVLLKRHSLCLFLYEFLISGWKEGRCHQNTNEWGFYLCWSELLGVYVWFLIWEERTWRESKFSKISFAILVFNFIFSKILRGISWWHFQ